MAFRWLLAALGALLSIAARCSPRFRAAITRDLVFEIGSEDGVARHFVFRARRVTSRPGHAPAPDCALRFATAAQGLRTFVSRRTVSHIVEGAIAGSVTIEGNPMRLLWFYDLTQRLVPLARKIPWTTPPGAYVVPSKTIAAAGRITREPPEQALDPSWQAATRQRAKLLLIRVASGEPTREF